MLSDEQLSFIRPAIESGTEIEANEIAASERAFDEMYEDIFLRFREHVETRFFDESSSIAELRLKVDFEDGSRIGILVLAMSGEPPMITLFESSDGVFARSIHQYYKTKRGGISRADQGLWGVEFLDDIVPEDLWPVDFGRIAYKFFEFKEGGSKEYQEWFEEKEKFNQTMDELRGIGLGDMSVTTEELQKIRALLDLATPQLYGPLLIDDSDPS